MFTCVEGLGSVVFLMLLSAHTVIHNVPIQIASQTTPYSLFSAQLLTRALGVLVKGSVLYWNRVLFATQSVSLACAVSLSD